MVGECQRYVMHSTLHQVISSVLQHGSEQPGELGAAGVVRGVCHEQGEGAK